jgi:hypothetical protein
MVLERNDDSDECILIGDGSVVMPMEKRTIEKLDSGVLVSSLLGRCDYFA